MLMMVAVSNDVDRKTKNNLAVAKLSGRVQFFPQANY
jgi:hypothetical protein